MNPVEISSDEFRRLAERVTQIASEYLETIDAQVISPATSGDQTLRLFRTPMPEDGIGETALNALPEVLRLSRVQDGRFFGYVLGSGEPVGAVAGGDEQTVVGWLAQSIGCPGFYGHLTGGGSSANLMGLAMARESKAPSNEKGVVSGGVVYASDQIHMSIPKSLALLGIGRDNLRLIPTDKALRMIPQELEARILEDRSQGRIAIAVVASAGTVSTGAIDPFPQIAAVARRHGAWFHVDGAYGALAAMAERRRFDGLELADSISLDPHKWLYQPLDCGCLLYRSPEVAQHTFAHSGDYARSLSADPIEGFVFFEESMELSRRFRALKLWLSLRYHGVAAFRRSIAKDPAQARRLAKRDWART